MGSVRQIEVIFLN